ncbi:uncharacterized protein B0H64DRAFT_446516 [Chaetomium fimeti]|uniref:O-methyltransferase domain-containing protein n=1 Tax=Chaetomium fimeti TaxID=1854472 RepID=A0AAE0H7A2_9PEZI|nr:hypothetical protein B0H64DRAFT_446516 [Chaetomium fimeti]
MDGIRQLEDYAEQLTASVKILAQHCRGEGSLGQLLAASDTPKNVTEARVNILASVGGIKALIGSPIDFLQHLASQVEIVACLRWLAEFQILACIPPEVSVPITDLADLTGIPEQQLSRVTRLTATHGLLREPKPGFVAHTPLSAQFTAEQSLLDAVVFMAESVAPAALQMASATQRFGATRSPTECAYNLAMSTVRPFHVARQESSKLDRQWSAYLCHAAGLQQEDALVDALSRLSWANLGNACIVEVGAQSTSLARRLARRFPGLRLVVQINKTHGTTVNPDCMWQGAMAPCGAAAASMDRASPSDADAETDSDGLSERITVSYRTPGMPQPVADAAVYVLHTPVAGPRSPSGAVGVAIRAELQGHLGFLRTTGGVMLILTTRLLPDPGSIPDREVEAVARTRDLNMLQLTNDGEMEMTELLAIIESVGDTTGKLAICNELRSPKGLILALAVKHQPY